VNKKEAVQILAILKASYPNFYKNLSQEDAQGIVSVWSMQFADMSAEVVFMALNKAVSISKYPPTIAEVKEKISSVHWESYEIINRNNHFKTLTDSEVEHYKRIYEETQGYRTKKQEPSITQIIGGGNKVKQLKEGG
jgi:hypothetical protein